MRTVHYKSAVQGCNFCMDTMLSLLAHTKEDFFMLYNVVVNDWGETNYDPTALGTVLLVVVLIALLAVAVVAYGVLQLLIDPYVLYPMQLIVDYILAFGALGLSGLFSNAKFGLLKGYITAVLGRYVFAVISGWIFFGAYAWEGWDPLPYSLAYNAIYIFAEAAVTLLILSVKPVQNLFSKLKQMALND